MAAETSSRRLAPDRGRRRSPRGVAGYVPVALAMAVVGLQIAYPLVAQGPARDRLTAATVVVFFAASVSHAVVWRGRRVAAALVVVTAGGGFAVEAVGVATGLPFGAYAYAESLGPLVAGVPVVIPMAWTMMAYPAYAVARRLTRSRWVRVPVAGWALASWDLFLDPQMVDAGHWSWDASGPAVLGIPLSNFAGWFLVATAMMAVLDVAAGRLAAGQTGRGGAVRGVTARGGAVAGVAGVAPADAPLYGLYLWVYASSVLSHLAFFGLPGSAVLGGIGMGVVAVPLALRLRPGRAHPSGASP